MNNILSTVFKCVSCAFFYWPVWGLDELDILLDEFQQGILHPIVPLSWEARTETTTSALLRKIQFSALGYDYECPQAAPGAAHSSPSRAPGFPPFASPIEIYSCRTLIFISWQARRMTQASFNLRIFLILLWFAALPAFPSSRILFPLHHLRHVEPIEEQPHARKSQTISKHNIFRKPSSAAVRFPRSVVAGSENFRTPHHSNMKILVGYSSRTNANTPK